MAVMDSRRMCPQCRAFITTRDRVCPYCNEEVAPPVREVSNAGAFLGGMIPHARFVTIMILLINCGLYAATAVASMSAGGGAGVLDIDPQILNRFGAKNVRAIFLGHQYWRLVTAGFLHGGLLHILMNSWVLMDLGAQVEEIFGAHRLIAIYFVATITGFAASAWWSSALSIGASAGIMGLVGAMIALGVQHRNPMGDAIRGHYLRWAIYIVVLGMLPGMMIDNAAHIGGLAGGFAVAYVAGARRYATPASERVWQLAAYASLALTAFCFLAWFQWFIRVTAAAAAA
jgi:rhomboid protease GluP